MEEVIQIFIAGVPTIPKKLLTFALNCFEFWKKTTDSEFGAILDVINVFWRTSILFLKHFFRLIDKSRFSSNCGFEKGYSCRTTKSCNFECLGVKLIPGIRPQSYNKSHDAIALFIRAQDWCFFGKAIDF